MKKLNSLKAVTLTLLSLLTLVGCNDGTSDAPKSDNSSTTEQDATKHITSRLKTQYETGTPVDLTPTLASGWTTTISIQQEGVTIVNKLDGTTYTFTQAGNYTILYNATNGSEKESLSVNIILVTPQGKAMLTLTGSKTTLDLTDGYQAIFKDKTSGETLLETTYSYTRTNSVGKTGFTNEENQVGPVFYVKYPEGTMENGIPKTARSKTLGEDGALTLEYDYGNVKDSFTCETSLWKDVFKGEKILSFTGSDSVFGPSSLDLYSDGKCSYNFMGAEVTGGALNPTTVYGGGTDGYHYGGGFWNYSGTTLDDFAMTLNIDGDDYTISKDATNKLQFTYTYSISAYKRVMTMSALPSHWEPALLGIAAEKVKFEGEKYTLICYDDDEKNAKLFSVSDEKTSLANGTYSFNSISRIFTLTFNGKTIEVPMDEQGRLYLDHVTDMPFSDDYLESPLDWADLFDSQGTKVFVANGDIASSNEEDISMTFFDNNTYLVKGKDGSTGYLDTGSYTLLNNTYTLTSEEGNSVTSTFTEGTFHFTYTMNNTDISFTFKPELTLKAEKTVSTGGHDVPMTYYLYAYKETGYQTPEHFQIFGYMPQQSQASHSDSGSYVLKDGVYTFTSAKYGNFSSTGTGDSLTVSYTYKNAQNDIELSFVPYLG